MVDLKCSICGGPANKLWLSNVDYLTGTANFVMQCWNGIELNAPSKYHYTLVKVKLLGVAEINQIAELENKIIELETQLAEVKLKKRK